MEIPVVTRLCTALQNVFQEPCDHRMEYLTNCTIRDHLESNGCPAMCIWSYAVSIFCLVKMRVTEFLRANSPVNDLRMSRTQQSFDVENGVVFGNFNQYNLISTEPHREQIGNSVCSYIASEAIYAYFNDQLNHSEDIDQILRNGMTDFFAPLGYSGDTWEEQIAAIEKNPAELDAFLRQQSFHRDWAQVQSSFSGRLYCSENHSLQNKERNVEQIRESIQCFVSQISPANKGGALYIAPPKTYALLVSKNSSGDIEEFRIFDSHGTPYYEPEKAFFRIWHRQESEALITAVSQELLRISPAIDFPTDNHYFQGHHLFAITPLRSL